MAENAQPALGRWIPVRGHDCWNIQRENRAWLGGCEPALTRSHNPRRFKTLEAARREADKLNAPPKP